MGCHRGGAAVKGIDPNAGVCPACGLWDNLGIHAIGCPRRGRPIDGSVPPDDPRGLSHAKAKKERRRDKV
jgi:hypothetical protein